MSGRTRSPTARFGPRPSACRCRSRCDDRSRRYEGGGGHDRVIIIAIGIVSGIVSVIQIL